MTNQVFKMGGIDTTMEAIYELAERHYRRGSISGYHWDGEWCWLGLGVLSGYPSRSQVRVYRDSKGTLRIDQPIRSAY